MERDKLSQRFNPTDEEIIHEYLLKKVTGKTHCFKEVIECDAFAEDELWRKEFQESPEKCLYFFTKKKEKKLCSASANRTTRRRSTWRAKGEDEKICMGEEQIGLKRSFRLEEDDDNQKRRDKCRWVMHEYRLDGIFQRYLNQDNFYVLCRITRTESKRAPKKKQVVEGNVAVVSQTNVHESILAPNPTLNQQTLPEIKSSISTKNPPPRSNSTAADAEEGGVEHTEWAKEFAKMLSEVDSEEGVRMEEKEEEVVLLPNLFYKDRWVRGWERAPDH